MTGSWIEEQYQAAVRQRRELRKFDWMIPLRRKFAGHTTRCIDGRLMRHDPQPDDPDLETDIGQCPECDGAGCVKQDDES